MAWGIFGLQSFPVGSSLETERSPASYLFICRVGLSKLFVNHDITC